jgi:putative FmdB family regulatory protein
MLYTYQCKDCGEEQDAHRSVENRMECPPCRCGGSTEKIISAYRVVGDMAPYYDENLETYVKGKQHRQKVMREKGVSEKYGKGWQ